MKSREEATPYKEKRCGKEKKAEKHRWDCCFIILPMVPHAQPWEHMLQPCHYREWGVQSKALVAVLWNSSVPLPQGCIPHRQLSATEQVQHTQVDRFLLPETWDSVSGWKLKARQSLHVCSQSKALPSIFSLSLSLSIRLPHGRSPRLIRLPFYFLSQASPLIKVLHIKFHLLSAKKTAHKWPRSQKEFFVSTANPTLPHIHSLQRFLSIFSEKLHGL